MNAVLIGLNGPPFIAVALMGFWALSQVGFGPGDDPRRRTMRTWIPRRADPGSTRVIVTADEDVPTGFGSVWIGLFAIGE